MFGISRIFLRQLKRNSLECYLFNKNKFFFGSKSKLKDYYQILDVQQQSSQEEIKKQFHKLAKLYHPDTAASTGDEEKFKEVSEAYNTLHDPVKREVYDSDLNEERQRDEEPQKTNYDFYFKQNQTFHQRRNYEEQETYNNAQAKAQNQSTQDEQRYKTNKDYRGFQNRDFDSGNMVKETIWENMKNHPEIWVLSQIVDNFCSQSYYFNNRGVIMILTLRWVLLRSSEIKNPNYSSDEDFEAGVPRGRIKLKLEDIKGMTLQQLEELDSQGKYQLPAREKASVEEYRSIAKSIKYDKNKIKQTFEDDDDDNYDDDYQLDDEIEQNSDYKIKKNSAIKKGQQVNRFIDNKTFKKVGME